MKVQINKLVVSKPTYISHFINRSPLKELSTKKGSLDPTESLRASIEAMPLKISFQGESDAATSAKVVLRKDQLASLGARLKFDPAKLPTTIDNITTINFIGNGWYMVSSTTTESLTKFVHRIKSVFWADDKSLPVDFDMSTLP